MGCDISGMKPQPSSNRQLGKLSHPPPPGLLLPGRCYLVLQQPLALLIGHHIRLISVSGIGISGDLRVLADLVGYIEATVWLEAGVRACVRVASQRSFSWMYHSISRYDFQPLGLAIMTASPSIDLFVKRGWKIRETADIVAINRAVRSSQVLPTRFHENSVVLRSTPAGLNLCWERILPYQKRSYLDEALKIVANPLIVMASGRDSGMVLRGSKGVINYKQPKSYSFETEKSSGQMLLAPFEETLAGS